MNRALPLFLLGALGVAGCAPAIAVHPRPDAALFPAPPRDALTFWGHATTYIDLDGYGIVTDPVFEGSYTPFHRRLIAAPPAASYARARLVLVSHAHHDHLSGRTLSRFAAGTVVLCPKPAAGAIDDPALDVRVMAPGDTFGFPGGQVIAVAADHPGGRRSLKARADGRALGYVVRTPRVTIYYSGDSKYFAGFQRVGATFHPDIAILNINAHLHTLDAVFAAEDVGAPCIIPSHALAYDGAGGRRNARWREEFIGLLGARVTPLAVGESRPLFGPGR